MLKWRKGWDSNPRYPCRHAGFQDRCLKPLGHPSVAATSITWRHQDQEQHGNGTQFGPKRLHVQRSRLPAPDHRRNWIVRGVLPLRSWTLISPPTVAGEVALYLSAHRGKRCDFTASPRGLHSFHIRRRRFFKPVMSLRKAGPPSGGVAGCRLFTYPRVRALGYFEYSTRARQGCQHLGGA